MEIQTAGQRFEVEPREHLWFWEKVNAGTWEPHTWEVFRTWVKPGAAVIDLGAWIGPTTLYAAALGATVHSIEADPVALQHLQANVAANPDLSARITVCPVAIAPRDGPVLFGSHRGGGDSTSSLLAGDAATSWSVPGQRWGTFLRTQGIARCDFLKMDIEGGEWAVLPEMLPWLQEVRPTLYLSLHPRNLHPQSARSPRIVGAVLKRWQACRELLAPLGFYPHVYNDQGQRVNLNTYWLQGYHNPAPLVFSAAAWPR